MTISESNIKLLAKAVCGDSAYTIRKSGPELVKFFNNFGENDIYGKGFPSRWFYTEEKIKKFNGKPELKKIIEASLDPRDYIHSSLSVNNAATKINEFLKFDGFLLKQSGEYYKVIDLKGFIVDPEKIKAVNHEFIQEQVDKCKLKIESGDYNGAITNARSLIEAVMIEILERYEGHEVKNDGNIDNLYKKIKEYMKLNPDRNKYPQTIIQILSGLNSITIGLSGLSNELADRHANKFKTEKHHATLAINSALTFCDFLLNSYEYQKTKNN